MFRATALWIWDNSASAFVDETDNTKADSSITFLSDANDKCYLGFDRRFGGLYAQLSTNGTYAGVSLSYWNGSEWTAVSATHPYSFDDNGYLTWVVPGDWDAKAFTSSDPHSAAPPDENRRFWLRITVSTVTTPAVISKLRVAPYTTYVSADELADFLNISHFTVTTTPSLTTIEELLRRAEDRIDFRTKKSWRFNNVVNELVDYNRHGVCLKHRDVLNIYSAQIWTGNTWNNLIEGRDEDYFLEPERGMVYFTRLFILPALYAPLGRYSWWWGYGEYKFNVRFSYAWGKDPEIDPQFHEVKEIALKLAAIDFITNHDYSGLLVSNPQMVDLPTKVAQWREETENKLGELESIFVW